VRYTHVRTSLWLLSARFLEAYALGADFATFSSPQLRCLAVPLIGAQARMSLSPPLDVSAQKNTSLLHGRAAWQ
jgi:hypothetical protein